LQKQKERGSINIDIDRFTNEQMERMVFDKDYNPLKDKSGKSEDPESTDQNPDEDDDDQKKAELRARFAAAN